MTDRARAVDRRSGREIGGCSPVSPRVQRDGRLPFGFFPLNSDAGFCLKKCHQIGVIVLVNFKCGYVTLGDGVWIFCQPIPLFRCDFGVRWVFT